MCWFLEWIHRFCKVYSIYIEYGVVDRTQSRSSITSKYVLSWHLIFDPYLTIHQPNIGVRLRKVSE